MRLLTTLLVLQLALTAFGFIRLGTVNSGGNSGRIYLIDTNTIFLFEFSSTNGIIVKGTDTSSSSTATIAGPFSGWNRVWDLSGDVIDSPSIEVLNASDSSLIASFYVPNNVYLPCNAEYLGRFSRPNKPATLQQLDGHVFLDRGFGRFFVAGLDISEFPPATYFWLDTLDMPSAAGIRAGYNGGYGIVRNLVDVDANVTLPPGHTTSDFKTLSVWCVDFYVSFGHVNITTPIITSSFACTNYGPKHLGFNPAKHDVTTEVYVLGPNTIGLNSLHYDGNPPATWYWGGWNSTLSHGFIISDQYNNLAPLTTQIVGENIVITLPTGYDVCNTYFLSIYCVKASVSFGHIYLNNSFGCQWCPTTCKTSITNPLPGYQCRDLSTTLKTRVEYNHDSTNGLITFKFHTCNLDPEQYIAFGLSGSSTGVQMIGGDVVVCKYSSEYEADCTDYDLLAKSQCALSGGSSYNGACPDNVLPSGWNNYYNTQVERVNGITTFTTTRAVTSTDTHDKDFTPGTTQSIIWARGGTFISATSKRWVLRHQPTDRIQVSDPILIDFSAASSCEKHFQCPATAPPPETPWTIPPLCIDSENNEIRAFIGNTGGLQGYKGITGQDGWGIAWYLDGLLIPEVYVLRNTTVRFYVNGGSDSSNAAEYHPFYITSSAEGGVQSLAIASQPITETVYAGLVVNGGSVWNVTTGGLCEWNETNGNGDAFNSWGEYQASLQSTCSTGNAWGWFDWVTGSNTPNEVYYQCATHRLLGWKIHVVDDLTYCQQLAAGYLTTPFSLMLYISVGLILLYGYY